MSVLASGIEPQLKRLRKIFLKIARAEFSCYPDGYDSKEKLSPLDGHCAVVSHLIWKLYGGDIVTGRIDGVPHYWNRLPDNKEIDLTSCQFGGDGFAPLKKGRKVKRNPKAKTNPRYLLAYIILLEEMKNGLY